jgi:hypothetical protein
VFDETLEPKLRKITSLESKGHYTLIIRFSFSKNELRELLWLWLFGTKNLREIGRLVSVVRLSTLAGQREEII